MDTGKYVEVLVEDQEDDEKKHVIHLWANENKADVIKSVPGVMHVYYGSPKTQYEVMVDPRYIRATVIENICGHLTDFGGSYRIEPYQENAVEVFADGETRGLLEVLNANRAQETSEIFKSKERSISSILKKYKILGKARGMTYQQLQAIHEVLKDHTFDGRSEYEVYLHTWMLAVIQAMHDLETTTKD